MKTIDRSSLPLIILIAPLLTVGLCACAVGGHPAASGTAARPTAASEAVQGSAGRPAFTLRAAACYAPTFVMEPLSELLDKYGPSAVEWSLMPHIAGWTTSEAVGRARWTMAPSIPSYRSSSHGPRRRADGVMISVRAVL